MWAIEYRGPLISGMKVPRSPALELGPSPYKEKGDPKRFDLFKTCLKAVTNGDTMRKMFASRIGKRSQEDMKNNIQALGVFGS